MPAPDLTIIYHGRCFDGMASAAVFARLARALHGEINCDFIGVGHQPGGSHVPDRMLTGHMNAVVDFRYTMSPRLTYWFDHHRSGLLGPEERAHYAADTSGRKHFDPSCGSCCRLIADRARDTFGVDLSALSELIEWAHRLDSADFPDARSACSLDTPAQRLMTVVEAHGDTRFLKPRIGDLSRGTSLEELERDPKVQTLLKPLRASHHLQREAVRARGRLQGDVLALDLLGVAGDRFQRFIPYAEFPDTRYMVAVSAGRTRTKISVGYNPWAHAPRTHDIAAMCSRYGGGGHAFVGAISLPPAKADRAREIASELRAALAAPPQ